MNGVQKTVAEALADLSRKVEEGAYGRDDDFDVSAFAEDMAEVEWTLASF